MNSPRIRIDAAAFALLAQDYINRHAPGYKFKYGYNGHRTERNNKPPHDEGSTNAYSRIITLDKQDYYSHPRNATNVLKHEVAHARMNLKRQAAGITVAQIQDELRRNPEMQHHGPWYREYVRQHPLPDESPLFRRLAKRNWRND